MNRKKDEKKKPTRGSSSPGSRDSYNPVTDPTNPLSPLSSLNPIHHSPPPPPDPGPSSYDSGIGDFSGGSDAGGGSFGD